MEPEVQYSNFKFNKPKGYKRHRKKFSFFSLALVLTLCVICFFVANLFFNFVNFMPAKSLTLEPIKLYALKMDQFSDKHSANVYAAEKRSLGAAGYVQTDTRFNVIAAVYKTKADAQKVAEQIKPQIPTVQVVEFSTPKKRIDLLDKEHKELCTVISKTFYENYELLYDLAVSFDTGDIGAEAVKVATIKAYNALNEKVSTLAAINQDQNYAPYTRLLQASQVQMVTLYNLAYGSNFIYGISSEIKNTYCNILYTYMELAKI